MHSSSPKQLITRVVLTLISMALIGCEDSGSAKQTKQLSKPLIPVQLHIHAWTGYAEPYLAEFKNQMRHQGFDVTIGVTSASGLDSFLDHLQNKKADLISPSADLSPIFVSRQLTQPVQPALIGNLNQINPLISKRLNLGAAQSYVVPFTFGPYALAYNQNTLAEPPTTYEVLWDVRYKNRVSLGTYDTANIYMVALTLRIPESHLFSLDDAELAQVKEKLRTLHTQQNPIYWGDNLSPENADKVDVATDWGVGVEQINRMNKGKWGITVPSEGATAWVDTWMLGSHVSGDTLKVAHAFVNHVLSSEVQAEVARQTSYGVVNMYASRHLTAEEVARFHIGDNAYLGKLILWQPLSEEVLAKYQAIWKEATE